MSGAFILLNIILFPLLCRSSKDASDVTWGHAINSRKALQDALQSDLKFLEADVSLGSTDTQNGIPIMAHPPETHSDISLEDWIATVIKEKSTKGIKLDFKSTAVFQPSLKILDKVRFQLTFPLWLNADILVGPDNASAKHVDAKTFLQFSKQYFPNATLSLGWTTELGNETRYTWQDVSEMARVIRCQKITQPVTFAVRGVFVGESVPQFLWLSIAVPDSTFTVWSGIIDPLQVTDLLALRKALPASQVYYDLPGQQNKDFLAIKNKVTSPKIRNKGTNLQLVTLSDPLFSCETEPILADNAIVYGGQGPVAVIHPVVKRYVDISGRFYPCDTEGTCASTFESKITVKVSNSSHFWNSNAWSRDEGWILMTFETSNPIGGSSCNVSFRITINNSDKDDYNYNSKFEINTGSSETCPILANSQLPGKIHGDMYVGVVIEGNRPVTIENFTIATVGGGASLASTSLFLLSIACVITLRGWL